MKLLHLTLTTAASLSATVQACAHFWGYITHSPIMGDTMDAGSEMVDDGRVVCSNSWSLRLEGDRFIYGCLPGYSLSVAKNGRDARYHAHGDDYTFGLGARSEKYCCIGACDDKGVKISCTDYSWDHWEFC
ncbi:hypothetical protein MCOR25_005020 [Pyricularia grisea]|uniref:Cyanovirin-N domain-containing protein n=1 Tax=Pyricularia grisea TaxID=148305 RepID=A0A6P8B6J8_PYRGI|nr:hypothetical protein PgNI_05541 [Pyricularia grisea]KAI6366969.1 hypothetical protein MCOR25_005020 [Pyricularia grisea]TLD10942.1 hypothetical protein PgNI_05541 [Pyricularia grisea]